VLTAGLTSGAPAAPYAFSTGTSFAAPHVAGAFAVLKSAYPGKSMNEIEAAISAGAFDLGTTGPDNESGAGLIDVVEAYMLLGGSTPADTDQDGVPDSSDQCPDTPAGESVDANGCSASQLDSENDGVADTEDNCILNANSDQRDTDMDGYGNICDPDFDNNGVVQAADLAYLKSKFFTADEDADLDGNGVVQAADLAILKNMFFQSPGPSCCAP
jgi:subtilisin family serine protease